MKDMEKAGSPPREKVGHVSMGIASVVAPSANAQVSAIGIGLFAVLAVQFATQPFFTQMFVLQAVPASTLVLTQEIVKFISGFAVLGLSGRLSSALQGWTLRESLQAGGLPAISYAVQNCFVVIAYQNLDSVVVNVVNQTKILFTAWFVYMLLGRRQSLMQVLALNMLFITALLVTYNGSSVTNESERHRDFRLGICCALIAAVLSGFGAAVTEYSLCGKKRNSYLFSAELGAYSGLAIVVNIVLNLNGDGARIRRDGFWNHWGPMTIVPCLSQSFGGILVGLVTQAIGSVRKNFAVICGLILTALLQWAIDGKALSPTVCLAVPLAAVSLYLHTMYPCKAVPKTN